MRRNREPAAICGERRSCGAVDFCKGNVNEQVGVGGGYRHLALPGGLFDPRVGLRGAFARSYRASIRSITLLACDCPPGAAVTID